MGIVNLLWLRSNHTIKRLVRSSHCVWFKSRTTAVEDLEAPRDVDADNSPRQRESW